MQVVVVDGGEPAAYPSWVEREVSGGSLVPELWAAGLARATGEVIALTSAGMVPDPGWVARIREVGRGPAAVVGGVIEPSTGLGLVDWAVYFCRYAPYMRPLPEASGRLEPAADNAVYQSDVLAGYRAHWQGAFWEPFVHRAMAAEGHRLVVVDDLVVRHAPGTSAMAFVRQRYFHGRAHGELRSVGMARGAILAASCSAPLVPLVMAARAGRLVASKRRCRLWFLLSLPLMLVFSTSWAVGELVGRLRAVRRWPSSPVTARY